MANVEGSVCPAEMPEPPSSPTAVCAPCGCFLRCSQLGGAVAVLTSYHDRGKRTLMGLTLAIWSSNLDVTRVTSTLDSLSRTSHIASPDHKHTKKYNPTRCLERRKPELFGDWLDDCHMPHL